MNKLKHILSSVKSLRIIGSDEMEVHALTMDSREAREGSLFFAVKGTQRDGNHFIEEVIGKGCKVIVCEHLPSVMSPEVTYVQVEHVHEVIGVMADSFYDHPSSKLKLVGITGTNGKTTCATLLFQLFSKLGYRCGLISTVQNQIGEQIIPSTHTTPDAIQLQSLLHEMVMASCSHVFTEVSSHAIHQHRIAGIEFTGACFTNITHDHLDYHQTFDEYIRVKKSFFDHLPSSAFSLSNADDKRGMVMLQNTKAKKKFYSLKTLADYKGRIIENNLSGLFLSINDREVFFSMIGEFNAYNLLCVYGTAMELGEDKQEVLEALSTLRGAEGRFDYVVSPKEKVLGIVDYAHTPDALLNVLATINKLRNGNETLFTIVGAGGNRDKAKRPVMARVACEHSDRVVLTSDNPRNEKASVILQEMEEGIPVHQKKKCIKIEDRKEAIKTVCSMSQQGDIILLAGKGHEKYQEIEGVKYEFDDKKILTEMLDLYGK